MKVKNPKKATCERVIEALAASKDWLSISAIRGVTGINEYSITAALDLLIKCGKVKALGTSNGVFYSLIYKHFGGAKSE